MFRYQHWNSIVGKNAAVTKSGIFDINLSVIPQVTATTYAATANTTNFPSSSFTTFGSFGSNASPTGTLVYVGRGSGAAVEFYIPQLDKFKTFTSTSISGQSTLGISFGSSGISGMLTPGTGTAVILKNGGAFQYGTYTGDGTGSRTISHNLSSFPGYVLVFRDGTNTWGFCYKRSTDTIDVFRQTLLLEGNSTAFRNETRTNWSTATTFTVESSINVSGATYYYYAFASTSSSTYCGDYNTSSGSRYLIDVGFQPGLMLTKGSGLGSGSSPSGAQNGGPYSWPLPSDAYTTTAVGYYAAELGSSGMVSEADTWRTNGINAISASNFWYGSNGSPIYFVCIKGPLV